MTTKTEGQGHAGGDLPRRLYVRNGGFLWSRGAARIRRILSLKGYEVAIGTPGERDYVAVWGASPTAHRGEALAERTDTPLVRIEDAFLRSLHPGRSGEPPMGLLIDHKGLHFDPATPSELEILLATHPLDDAALLARARGAMAHMQEAHLSKFSATRRDIDPPAPGYVLVVDQTEGDASVRASRADRSRFLEMLTVARIDHPGARFVIKTHPETAAGHRPGHFRDGDAGGDIAIHDGPASPWQLLDGAIAVYTVSSQMGFESILAGHKPRVFGTPFYAGWGLTDDEDPLTRRTRTLTRAQLFAATMILYPVWYDPYRDRLCELEDVLSALDAQTRAWRDDRRGWVAEGMRLWKRAPLQAFFGKEKRLRFEDDVEKSRALASAQGRRRMVWASKAQDNESVRVEDGFLRSRGLGADLIPPLSLVCDDLGIYYDPADPSRLEHLIQRRARDLRPDQIRRSEALIDQIRANSLSKYNLSGDLSTVPGGFKILVPGQVEDDASILRGSPDMQSNEALLDRVRAANPQAKLLWKPHPDVVAGLRKGVVQHPKKWADLSLPTASIAGLLTKVDAVWTMTSLTGFEALLRNVPVVTLGVPFYAGWGLTRDLGPVPERRLQGPRPSLAALVHATLIDYPRYFDPLTGEACPVEVIVDRLANDEIPRPGPFNRSLSKLQGLFASQAHLWRSKS